MELVLYYPSGKGRDEALSGGGVPAHFYGIVLKLVQEWRQAGKLHVSETCSRLVEPFAS